MNDQTIQEMSDADSIRSRILTIRGVQVMLASDLAMLYGVPTKRLNEQVKRNLIRFPHNFMFMLSDEEVHEVFANGTDALDRSRSQIATLNKGRGHNIKYRPYAFTEHGILMLASVRKSEIAALAAQFTAIDRRLLAHDKDIVELKEKVDFFVQTQTPPLQGVFYDGQLWDARALVLKLIQSAKRSLIPIDNWATAETLDFFAKKRKGVGECRHCENVASNQFHFPMKEAA